MRDFIYTERRVLDHSPSFTNAFLVDKLIGGFVEGYFEKPEKMEFGKTSDVGKLFK